MGQDSKEPGFQAAYPWRVIINYSTSKRIIQDPVRNRKKSYNFLHKPVWLGGTHVSTTCLYRDPFTAGQPWNLTATPANMQPTYGESPLHMTYSSWGIVEKQFKLTKNYGELTVIWIGIVI